MRSQKLDIAQLAKRSGIRSDQLESILNKGTDLDVSTAAKLGQVLREPAALLMRPKATSVALSSDGKLILTTVSDDRTVRLWKCNHTGGNHDRRSGEGQAVHRSTVGGPATLVGRLLR